MTAKLAFKYLLDSIPEFELGFCMEYPSMYVFHSKGMSKPGTESVNRGVFGGKMYAIRKSDGKMAVFKPFMIPVDEYNSGKEVPVK